MSEPTPYPTLAEAAELEVATYRRGPTCGIARIKETLDKADAATLDRLLAEAHRGERTATSITRILARVGVTYHSNNVTYHLRGECSCDKAEL